MSYSTDKVAIKDAEVICTLFNISMEALQIKIASIRVTLDNMVSNTYKVSVDEAKRFFKKLATLPDEAISGKVWQLF